MARKKEKGWGTKQKFLWQAEGTENLKEGKVKLEAMEKQSIKGLSLYF